MKNTILITISIVALMMSACANNGSQKEEETHIVTIIDTEYLDCMNIENNMVEGLPDKIGEARNSPSVVQQGIIYYRELAKSGDQNSAFYTSNADLMEAKLKAFNERFIRECQ